MKRLLVLAAGIGLFLACGGDATEGEVGATGPGAAGTGAASTAKGGTGGVAAGGAGAGAAGDSGVGGTGGGGVAAGSGGGGVAAGSGGGGKGGMGGAGTGDAAGAAGAGMAGGAGKGGSGASGAGAAGAAGGAGAGSAGAGGAAAGSGGEAGAGASGGSAGAGPTSWKQCTAPGTCVARANDVCCFDCDMHSAEGAYWKLVAEHDADVCKAHPNSSCGGPCYPKAHFQGQSFLGVCENGACGAVDVRTSPLSACVTNDDCVLRHAGCCPTCIPDLSRLIALAKNGVDDYLAQACNPEAPEACDACAPAFPEGASAVCNAKGHCEVKYPPAVCPKDPPVEGTACTPVSVAYCDYGDAPVGCRDRFFCENSVWTKHTKACAKPAVLTDCPEDCSNKGVACSTQPAVCLGASGALWGCYDGHWACYSPPAPSPCAGHPPHNGQPCSEEGATCEYGACAELSATKRVCQEGVWVDKWMYCLP